MSWKAGVKTEGDKDWVYNALRFATKKEAEGYIDNLSCRWFAVKETHVEECSDPVNHIYINGKAEEI